LLIAAMGDVLPPEIARRVTKGSFDAEHYRGLRVNLPVVLELCDGRLAELGLVDAGLLRAALQQAAAGLPAPFGLLEPAIAAEVWLRSLASARPTEWTAGTAAPTGGQRR
jgi:asparagine synthase (glutamine-hydrolysing)